MTNSSFKPDAAMRRSVESDHTLPLREMRDKFALRWPLLLLCAVLVPVVAALLTSLVPTTYTATAQLMIRHESASLRVFDSPGSSAADASGPSSAELIRSIPVISGTIQAVEATDADVARPAYKVLFRHLYKIVAPLLPSENTGEAKADPVLQRTFLANEFKDSIKVTVLQTEARANGPQDELLEVKLTSTNAQKVATMVNVLCEMFIKEHNARSAIEASNAINVLTNAEQPIRDQIASLLEKPLDPLSSKPAYLGSMARPEFSQPLTESLARHVADLELSLVEARRAYGADSPELKKAEQTLNQTRAVFVRQETLDGLNAQLTSLKEKERAVRLSLDLIQQDQTGLSVVERGLPPRVTTLVKVMKYAVPVGASLFLGTVVGLGLIVMSNAMDGKVRSHWDVERITGVPLAGIFTVPGNAKTKTSDVRSPVIDKLLGKLDVESTTRCRIITVIAPGGAEDASSLSRQLAESLTGGHRNKVLLVDGNLQRQSLTRALHHEEAQGLAELLSDPQLGAAGLLIHQGASFAFLPAGKAAANVSLAMIRQPWATALGELRAGTDFIVIDAGSWESGRATRVLLQSADAYLLACISGVTDLQILESTVQELPSSAPRFLGAVLIQTK